MNHMREGGTAGISLSASAALCRITSAKSVVQVRCRVCQEILSCPLALREHCEGRTHAARIAQLASISGEAGHAPGGSSATAAIPESPSPETILECRHCSFETTDTAEHMQQHGNSENSGVKQRSSDLEAGSVKKWYGKCSRIKIVCDHVELLGNMIAVDALKFLKLVFDMLQRSVRS
uniref:C2H2-type domain-containing protein n=1 Tax=Setaria digitata TaxID=48799 RepID=A0A915PRG9_9BILA